MEEDTSQQKHQARIYGEILEERDRQDQKWGGQAHDDKHDPCDWIAFIRRHIDKSAMPSFRRCTAVR